MLLLLVESGVVLAEGGCPAGMIPYSGTDISSCGPAPAGYYGDNNPDPNNAMPAHPVPIWKKTWGAIAVDNSMGKVGAVAGKMTKSEAQESAIAECHVRGGEAGCSHISLTYKNQCAAMAWGVDKYVTSSAETIELASNSAIKECKESTKDCKIYYSACSDPIRIQ